MGSPEHPISTPNETLGPYWQEPLWEKRKRWRFGIWGQFLSTMLEDRGLLPRKKKFSSTVLSRSRGHVAGGHILCSVNTSITKSWWATLHWCRTDWRSYISTSICQPHSIPFCQKQNNLMSSYLSVYLFILGMGGASVLSMFHFILKVQWLGLVRCSLTPLNAA